MNLPLTSIEIKKFRGLRDVKLEDMGQVNLIVGVNNSGKTSVLEAISTFCKPLEFRQYSEIARQRESVNFGSDVEQHYRWLFSQALVESESWHGENFVCGSGAIDVRETHASAKGVSRLQGVMIQTGVGDDGEPEYEEANQVENRGIEFTFQATGSTWNEPDAVRQVVWNGGNFTATRPLSMTKGCKVQTLSPYIHRLQPGLLKRLSLAIQDDWVSEVVALLGQIDPLIQSLKLLSTDDGRSQIHLRHRHLGSMPLQAFGDGVRRTVLYALSVPSVQGGVLLIDEIESAIHVSALPKVFHWLVAACKKFDVQLIATTHSLEAVDAVIEGMEVASDLVAYRLESNDGKIAANRIAGDLLRRIRFDRGLEVR